MFERWTVFAVPPESCRKAFELAAIITGGDVAMVVGPRVDGLDEYVSLGFVSSPAGEPLDDAAFYDSLYIALQSWSVPVWCCSGDVFGPTAHVAYETSVGDVTGETAGLLAEQIGGWIDLAALYAFGGFQLDEPSITGTHWPLSGPPPVPLAPLSSPPEALTVDIEAPGFYQVLEAAQTDASLREGVVASAIHLLETKERLAYIGSVEGKDIGDLISLAIELQDARLDDALNAWANRHLEEKHVSMRIVEDIARHTGDKTLLEPR